MNAPREPMLAGASSGAFLERHSLATALVLFLARADEEVNEQHLYEEALLNSQIWKEMQGMVFDAGYTHAVEIIDPRSASHRGVIWTQYPGFHARRPSEYRGAAPYKLLIFPETHSLIAWKARFASEAKGFSVHPNIITPQGKTISGALLLALHNHG